KTCHEGSVARDRRMCSTCGARCARRTGLLPSFCHGPRVLSRRGGQLPSRLARWIVEPRSTIQVDQPGTAGAFEIEATGAVLMPREASALAITCRESGVVHSSACPQGHTAHGLNPRRAHIADPRAEHDDSRPHAPAAAEVARRRWLRG